MEGDALDPRSALVSGLAGGNWTIPSFVALVVGAALLVAGARRSTGVTVVRARGPRSQGLFAARILAALACIWGATVVDGEPIVVLIAAVALIATTLLGLVYDDALRHDIAEGAARP